MVKNPRANAGDMSSIPGSGRSPGGGNGNPLKYSCLGNPMDRGAWWATVHGVAKELDLVTKQQNQHQEQEINFHYFFFFFFFFFTVFLLISNYLLY